MGLFGRKKEKKEKPQGLRVKKPNTKDIGSIVRINTDIASEKSCAWGDIVQIIGKSPEFHTYAICKPQFNRHDIDFEVLGTIEMTRQVMINCKVEVNDIVSFWRAKKNILDTVYLKQITGDEVISENEVNNENFGESIIKKNELIIDYNKGIFFEVRSYTPDVESGLITEETIVKLLNNYEPSEEHEYLITEKTLWFEKGYELSQSENYEEALKCFDKIIKMDPEDVIAIYNKGLTLYLMKLFEDCISCMNQIMKLSDTDYDSRIVISLCYDKLGDSEKALDFYNKAISINPIEKQAWVNKMVILKELGRKEDLEKCWKDFEDKGLNDNYGTWEEIQNMEKIYEKPFKE